MALSKNFKTDIEIAGKLDPSVSKVVGLSVKELYRINKAYQDITAIQRKANLVANGLPQQFKKLP